MEATQQTFKSAEEVFRKFIPGYEEKQLQSNETEEQRIDRLAEADVAPLIESLKHELDKLNLRS